MKPSVLTLRVKSMPSLLAPGTSSAIPEVFQHVLWHEVEDHIQNDPSLLLFACVDGRPVRVFPFPVAFHQADLQLAYVLQPDIARTEEAGQAYIV